MSDDAPERCPGHTCTLGRIQDWIAGEGKIDGRWSDLPPGHAWYRDGEYLAHETAVGLLPQVEPPFDLRITIARSGDRLADILARVKQEPGSMPEFTMTGQCYRVSHDEDTKEEWKAWLWPEGGVHPPTDTSTEAMTRPSCGDLEVLLNKRLKSKGKWWK